MLGLGGVSLMMSDSGSNYATDLSKSRWSQIKRKYGYLGYCRHISRPILNTVDNAILCFGCRFLVEYFKDEIERSKGK